MKQLPENHRVINENGIMVDTKKLKECQCDDSIKMLGKFSKAHARLMAIIQSGDFDKCCEECEHRDTLPRVCFDDPSDKSDVCNFKLKDSDIEIASCKWKVDSCGVHNTQCGHGFSLGLTESLEKEGFINCPSCGGKIEEG